METLKSKLYKAPFWGSDSFWQVSLTCDNDGELRMEIGIARCGDSGVIVDWMPFGKSGPVKDKSIVGLKKQREDIQRRLFRDMGPLTWDYDREAFARKYRWNDDLYLRDHLRATRPDWEEIEPDWEEWHSTHPWEENNELTFEDWLAQKNAWHNYDPTWLVELAVKHHPDKHWLHEALMPCSRCRYEGNYGVRDYFSFIEKHRSAKNHHRTMPDEEVIQIYSTEEEWVHVIVSVSEPKRVIGIWFPKRSADYQAAYLTRVQEKRKAEYEALHEAYERLKKMSARRYKEQMHAWPLRNN